MDTTGQHASPWSRFAMPAFPPLAENARADVCVIGAGIAGMTTAYLLGRKGKRVLVIDDGPVGGGMTSATTAHLATAIDDRYYEVERLHGADGARLAATTHSAAVEAIEAIVAQEAIDCDFARLDGYLFLPPDGDAEELEREFEAARRAGIDVAWAERAPMDGVDTGRCLRFPKQGQFHPLKYLAGLARAIVRDGGRIHCGVHAERIESGDSPCVVTSSGLRIDCDDVVVATNAPISDRVAIHTKQAPYMTYVIGLRVPRGAVAGALFWDTLDAYHYVRLDRPDGELLIVGGEDHKSGQAHDHEARFANLERWARERFPAAGEVVHRWSGQVMETVDYLAFIGADPGGDHVWVATGDSGMGMTHGTIAGILLTDLIHGAEVPWAKLYSPSRFPARAAKEYLRENANVAAQYGDWLKPAEAEAAEAIAPGSGAVIRRGVHRIAVYRDPEGATYEMSAACTHLGCVVSWNAHEHTWDCPCHGSRFDCRGEVINGPAVHALRPAEQPSGPHVRNSRQPESRRPTPGL